MKTKKFYFFIPYFFVLLSLAVHEWIAHRKPRNMKQRFYFAFVFVFFFVLTGRSQNFSPSQNIDQGWQTRAFAYLQNEQYSFKAAGEKSFHAVNTKNKLGVHVTPVGYSIGRDELTANFMIKSVAGKKVSGDQLRHVESTATTLRYHYSTHTIEYKNSEEGLRQNFILNEKGRSASVLLQITSSLQPELLNDRLVLKDKSGKKRFYYDGLKVWDANGKLLEASMQLKKDELAINVNDKDAVYPITIDPLNHTPEWTTSADDILTNLLGNLAVDAIYGFTVAGLGDVNGDGYDDVAVSAPGMADIITGSGTFTSVGAVFVYLGSSTGLPTTPNHVLQPTTAVTGALFGFSVTGGDVTGDGINDVIVGAPMDRVQATIGGIADATVGKVYIYQGGATLTGQNPTPLLNINLDGTLLGTVTVTLNPLFGFSVAVADDMNGDGKGEIVVGAPTYARLDGITAVKTGGAFVYLSNPSNTFTTIRSLEPPTGSVLGLYNAVESIVKPVIGDILWSTVVGPLLAPVLNGQVEGLLFGFSVDGTGDYNNDGNKDVVVGAPAGINLGTMTSGLSLSALVSNLLSGQILGGSAYVFGGTGTGVNTSSLARLQATSTGLLSNAANLFGYSVRGVKDAAGNRNGNILAGAPVGAVLSNVVSGLKVQAGQLHVFKKKLSTPSSPVSSDQVLASPRATNILSLLSGDLTLGVLYASSIDNMLDVNCDGIGDIIVGEPLSTSIGLLNADAVGGAAYVYLGQSNGSYVASPYWTLTSEVSPLLGVNATALLGYSVAGAGHVKGMSQGVRALVGGPANSLDFGIGLLNLGNTVGTLLDFAVDDNGLGKAYTFAFNSCGDSDHDGIPDVIDVDDDNDGIPDRYEFAQSQNTYLSPSTDPSADDDGDGIVNYKDVDYGGTLNPMGVCGALDKDGDGIPNHLDLDSDNDGLQDVIEAGGADANGDGRLDCSGSCDADGDGLLAPVDLNDNSTDVYATTDSKLSNGSVPGTASGFILDTDGDGVPDFLDIDSDNDGIYDLIETGGADADGNGRVDYSGTFASNDADNDGWINSYDADTNNDGDVSDAGEGTAKALIISSDPDANGIANTWTDGSDPDQFPVDFDSDILPNYRDLDSDSDGINDVIEAGGADPDGNGIIGSGASSAALVDDDGYASATLTNPLISTDPDINADGRPDDDSDIYQTPYHNGGGGQPSNFNPDQDGDSRPNFLDLDSDNDGINDIVEYTGSMPAYDADGDGMIDDNVATDTDRDGIAAVVDGAPAAYGDASDAAPINTDGIDTNPGAADNDNVPDYLDLDSDNDGVFDSIEGGNSVLDSNKDGIIDCDGNVYTACDPDLDGILEKVDGKPLVIGDAPGVTLPDTDTDGIPDYRELDSDNDGILDVAEKGPGADKDSDNDGRVDGTDTDGDGIINIPAIDNNNIFGGNDASILLPVHLTRFSGLHKENEIHLSWSTENEMEMNRYEVQRSVNGRDFTTIGIVFSNGSIKHNDYLYKDGRVSSNVVYYRLKMVDEDASYSYSSILQFRFDNSGKHIQVYPNPVRTDFTISLQGMSAGTYRIELVNASGLLLFTKQVSVEGSYSEKMNRKNIPSGLYMLRVANKKTGETENFSIIFQ